MADPIDILTPEEATRAALGVDGAGQHASAIARANTAVSERIDDLCGPVVAREVAEVHDGGHRFIWPRQAPVFEVTSLGEFDGATLTTFVDESAFGTVGTANGFAVVDGGHRIERRSGGGPALFTAGAGSLELVYLAGRFPDTESVSSKFKVAAEAILRRVWDREASAWARATDPFEENLQPTSRFFRAVDPMIDEWLASERKLPGMA